MLSLAGHSIQWQSVRQLRKKTSFRLHWLECLDRGSASLNHKLPTTRSLSTSTTEMVGERYQAPPFCTSVRNSAAQHGVDWPVAARRRVVLAQYVPSVLPTGPHNAISQSGRTDGQTPEGHRWEGTHRKDFLVTGRDGNKRARGKKMDSQATQASISTPPLLPGKCSGFFLDFGGWWLPNVPINSTYKRTKTHNMRKGPTPTPPSRSNTPG